MKEERQKLQVETFGTFLREELGVAREDIVDDLAARSVEMLEETGLLPQLSQDRERTMRFELRNLHRSAVLIRRIGRAIGLPDKEKNNET